VEIKNCHLGNLSKKWSREHNHPLGLISNRNRVREIWSQASNRWYRVLPVTMEMSLSIHNRWTSMGIKHIGKWLLKKWIFINYYSKIRSMKTKGSRKSNKTSSIIHTFRTSLHHNHKSKVDPYRSFDIILLIKYAAI
jgi:hypothetical protein